MHCGWYVSILDNGHREFHGPSFNCASTLLTLSMLHC